MKWAIILALVCAVLGALAQLFLKLGSSDVNVSFGSGSLNLVVNWKLMMGFALYGLSSILFIIALKGANLSIAYPMIATSYIWVAVLSTFVLREAFPAWKWIGLGLILAGVTIIGL